METDFIKGDDIVNLISKKLLETYKNMKSWIFW